MISVGGFLVLSLIWVFDISFDIGFDKAVCGVDFDMTFRYGYRRASLNRLSNM